MQKKSEDFSIQEAQRLAASPAGQQLLTLLQSSQDPRLHSAMDAVQAGDLTKAQKLLSQALASGELQKILKQLR